MTVGRNELFLDIFPFSLKPVFPLQLQYGSGFLQTMDSPQPYNTSKVDSKPSSYGAKEQRGSRFRAHRLTLLDGSVISLTLLLTFINIQTLPSCILTFNSFLSSNEATFGWKVTCHLQRGERHIILMKLLIQSKS